MRSTLYDNLTGIQTYIGDVLADPNYDYSDVQSTFDRSGILDISSNLKNLDIICQDLINRKLSDNPDDYTVDGFFSSMKFRSRVSGVCMLMDDIQDLTYDSLYAAGVFGSWLMYKRKDLIADTPADLEKVLSAIEPSSEYWLPSTYASAYFVNHLTGDLSLMASSVTGMLDSLKAFPTVDPSHEETTGIEEIYFRYNLVADETSKTKIKFNDQIIEACALTGNNFHSLSGNFLIPETNILFRENAIPAWPGLRERHDEVSELPEGYSHRLFGSSSYGATFCFWAKLDHARNANSETDFVTFCFNDTKPVPIKISNISLVGADVDPAVNEMYNFNYGTAYENLFSNDEFVMFAFQVDEVESRKPYIKGSIFVRDEERNPKQIEILDPAMISSFFPESQIDSSLSMPFQLSGIYIGNPKIPREGNFLNYYRNFVEFAGCLTDIEMLSLFEAGIKETYNLPSEFKTHDIVDLIKSEKFYLGLVGLYDVTNINIINCVMKYNGTSYSIAY